MCTIYIVRTCSRQGPIQAEWRGQEWKGCPSTTWCGRGRERARRREGQREERTGRRKWEVIITNHNSAHKCTRNIQTHASSPRLPRSNAISFSSASAATTTTAPVAAAPFVWGGEEAGANDICPDFARQMCSVAMLCRLPSHAHATSTPARA